MALGVALTMLLNIDQTDYSNLIVNLFLLGANIGLLRIFTFSRHDLGLQRIKPQMKWQVKHHE
jgi:hypothetical protein